ncbi:MAG TPA: endopeptidase La [Trueperaceae bacterium]|nr:endopeptidase La [Trueperaceae bacterium]
MDWELPVIALRSQVVLPRTLENIDVGRLKSKQALEDAQASDNRVLLVTQLDHKVDDPNGKQLYRFGTLSLIKQVIRLPDDTLQVLIEGKERVRVGTYINNRTLRARVQTVSEHKSINDINHINALVSRTKSTFQDYVQFNKSLKLDAFHLETFSNIKEPGALADIVAKYAMWTAPEKQKILEELDIVKRLDFVLTLLTRDLERFDTEKRIHAQVKKQMDSNQREYYLREKVKAIQKELGNDEISEIDQFKKRAEEKNMPKLALERVTKELDRLAKMNSGSPEATVVRSYLEVLLDLPWSEKDNEHLDTKHTQKILDEDHFSLDEPKERILEFLAVRQLTKDIEDSNYKPPIMCMVGPPGVGKTSLAKSIARSLDRKFIRMSLGGVRDEAEIRGHRRTYIGSLPGRIIQGMRTAQTVNPVFLLDEIDKMTSDFRGDPSSALLEVLDPEQNNEFNDHYLEIPYDLSQVMFITTANSLNTIPRPLLDRMEIIRISGYTLEEKMAIAKLYRIPQQLKDHGMSDKLVISDLALRKLITEYSREAGVRNLDRMIAKVARKAAKEYLDKSWSGLKTLEPEDISKLLGVAPYRDTKAEKQPQIGLTHGLAWTPVGGVTLDIETVSLPGKGKLALTGQLGDVMKESAQAGIAYLRKHAQEFNLPLDFHESHDLHIHVLEGATPKDGPSAGIAMALSVVSALTNRPIRGDVAMTGEITLRGRVLAIGGVKEKLLAAHQAGIEHVIIPDANKANLEDVPELVLKELTVSTVKDFAEVLEIMLIEDNKANYLPLAEDSSGDGVSARA